ncbi:MAG TPA: SDR family oxidoreductase [Planctomicrobium sp.]|nr:SDR family oxidoreductase [Planctomicrobium sp.]
MSSTIQSRPDPRTRFSQKELPPQQQEVPGKEKELSPLADHGENSYKGSGKLKDTAAVITGADSGIGRSVAIAYAREGADVMIAYLEETEDAQETATWVEKAGQKSVLSAGDIGSEEYCISLIEQTFEEFGKLDILVNNAAFQMPWDELEEWSSEQFEYTFRTNLFSMFYLCKAALPRMKPGGVIINTASIQAYQPSAELLDYAASKSAIVGFTKALSKIAIESGVRVNAVAPGPVWTPLIPSTFDEKKVQEFGKNTLFDRPAQPSELAPLFVFLASPEASYVTGEVYGATGGRSPF